MNIHLHPWASLKKTFPVRKSEWVFAFMTLGLWLVFSLNDDLFSQSPGYNGLARLASQATWAWFFFVIGIGRVAVLFINGGWRRSPHWRAVFAFLNCLVWYRLAIGLAPNVGIGIVMMPGILILDGFNFKQAAVEAAASEGLHIGDRKRLRPHA